MKTIVLTADGGRLNYVSLNAAKKAGIAVSRMLRVYEEKPDGDRVTLFPKEELNKLKGCLACKALFLSDNEEIFLCLPCRSR